MTPRRRRRPPVNTPFTNLDDVPLVLFVRDMARLYRQGVTTIRRRLRAGTFRPRPDGTNPYTWKKATILRDLESPPPDTDDTQPALPLTH